MGNYARKLLLEIILFISMAVLAGHVTVNFWERYIVQDKLSEIKNSLDHLKITVHNMGYAYDDLQRDLLDLARFNPKPTIDKRGTLTKQPCKRRKELDKKMLDELTVTLSKGNDKDRHIFIADKSTGRPQMFTKTLTKHASTATRYPMKATAIGSEPVSSNNFHGSQDENNCVYKCRLRNSARKCFEDCENHRLIRF